MWWKRFRRRWKCFFFFFFKTCFTFLVSLFVFIVRIGDPLVLRTCKIFHIEFCYDQCRPEYNFFSGRTDCSVETMLYRTMCISDRTSDKTFFWKKSGHGEIEWFLKQFGATVPWWISNLGKHMSISIQ